jgi:predicted ABC-class ATPase
MPPKTHTNSKVGVFDHVPGDGREFVTVSPSAAAIRAEDGRSITGTDISNFIQNLPYGKVGIATMLSL